MLTQARQRGMQMTALVALGLCLVAGLASGQGGSKPTVPEDDYPKLRDQQVKVLQDALKVLLEAKDKEEKKKLTEKARCTAIMVAAIAQDDLAGKDGAQRASLRDAAIAIAALLKTDNVADAAKQATALKDIKGDGTAKTEKVKLFDAHIELPELMTQYKLSKAGGQGFESSLLKLATDKKKMIPPAAMNDNLLLMAYMSALTAEFTVEHKPPRDQKVWNELCADMRKGALELATTVKAKDGKAAFTALNRLNTSCSVCHDKFRK